MARDLSASQGGGRWRGGGGGFRRGSGQAICPRSEVVLVSNEAHLPYYRMNLTRYLAGEVPGDQLDLHPEAWYAQNGIQLLRKVELCALDLANKELSLQDEGGRVSQASYHRLILASGARPFLPPFPGADLENVTVLRTREDADFILAACRTGGPVVVIGGGLLGLETAGALARQRVEVTVLENQAWLLPRQLNRTAGELFLAHVRSLGIRVLAGARTHALVGNGRVSGVQLEDGTTLPAGLVIISAGIRSNVELPRRAGLKVNQGILVDDALATSDPDVFAAGDVAEHRGVVYGIWPPSQAQGAIAGMNAAGESCRFAGLPRSNTLKVLGYDLFSIGQIVPEGPLDLAIDARDDGNYACFVFRSDEFARVMVGAILLGDTRAAPRVKKAVENQLDCTRLLQRQPGVQDILENL